LPEAEEWPVECPRCGYAWNWLRNQITRCPKCARRFDVSAVKTHFADKSATTLTLGSFEAFQKDMQGEVGKLIRDSRRRS